MGDELRRLFRYANIGLAVTIPILIAGVVLLRGASEGVLHAFGLAIFFLPMAIFVALEERGKRRRRRGQ